MRIATLTIVVVFLFALSTHVTADRNVGSVELSANPTLISADGKSECTISARVRDRDGNFVPDGTEVRFSASLGVIEESGVTSSGVARVKLVSADIPGTSVVTATWVNGPAVAQTSVQFVDSADLPKGPEFIHLQADEYLAYSADYRVVEALGKAHLRYRSLSIRAGVIQVDLNRNRIVAKAMGHEKPVRIQGATGDIVGDIFACDLMGSSGLLLSTARGTVEKITLYGAKPEISTEEAFYSPEDMELVDTSVSSVLVKGKAATIFPNEKIQFRGAQVYIDGKRMISLPLYVLWLTEYQSDEERYVGYSTSGLTLNFPFYYMLSPSSSGAVLIRHGERTGWGDYGQKPGWFIDLRQKYSTNHSEGALVVSQITSGEWGAYFTHTQDLGANTRAYLYMDYPSHRDLFASLSLSRSLGDLEIGLTRDQNIVRDGKDLGSTDIHVRMRPKMLGKTGLRYNLSARSTYTTEAHDRYELGGSIYSPEIRLAPNLSLRSSLALGNVWAGPALSGLSTVATAVFDWSISDHNRLSLVYRYSDRAVTRLPQRTGLPSPTETKQQTLSASWIMSDKDRKWFASLYGIKSLTSDNASLFADLSYRLSSDWRIAARSLQNKYSGISYDDLELSLGRRIGSRELLAVWSKSQRKIMFELGSAVF